MDTQNIVELQEKLRERERQLCEAQFYGLQLRQTLTQIKAEAEDPEQVYRLAKEALTCFTPCSFSLAENVSQVLVRYGLPNMQSDAEIRNAALRILESETHR